jgi:dipeptidyl aminopeptidase/acylaminoacyl peptidase
VLGVLALLAAAPAGAAERAHLAFEADGAIYTMDADGSQRTRLTEGLPFTGHFSDYRPRWSPDGGTIVFDRSSHGGRIWAIDAGGGDERQLVPGRKHFHDHVVGVTRAGRVVFEHYRIRSGRFENALYAIDLDGRHLRRLLDVSKLGSNFALSPDGTRLLYTRSYDDADYTNHPSLYVVRLDGTHGRRLAKAAREGAWSPDGKRIAFASVRDGNGSTCSSDTCDYNGEIYVMRANGTHLVRLTNEPADDRNPSWSADGSRIAFDSDRNFTERGYGENQEIYSIGTDGSCLTWLTNGNAASEDAVWRPRPAGDPAPVACGDAGREPVVEVDTSEVPPFTTFPSYWFGAHGPQGTILTSARGGFDQYEPRYRYVAYFYFDCGEYNADGTDCGEPVSVFSDPTCQAYSAANNLPNDLGTARMHRHRGALVTQRRSDGAMYIYTGRITVAVRGPNHHPDALVDRLRRSGEEAVAGGLPEARLPDGLWKRLHAAEESYARTHDEVATADELGISVTHVRHRLRAARRLRELGVDGRTRCK